jgi:sulfur relay (sulfurtransferase) DsrC/TusE family protein
MIEINSVAKMDTSSSLEATPSPSSKPTYTRNKNKSGVDDTIAVNEKISLTKNQYEVLNMICKSYEKSISEYMQEALVRTMQSDIEDGLYLM